MRSFYLLPLALLAACRQEPDQPAQAPAESREAVVTYAGAGRDRLCLDEGRGRIGFITYGQGDMNCSVRGAVVRSGDRLSIAPDGDESCRVDATVDGERLALGPVSTSCGYYCGAGASFAGKAFTRSSPGSPAEDFAGDPLC